MATTSILAVPGIRHTTPGVLRGLADMADRNGWNADGIAGYISHESGFRANARNPTGAAGLGQFIEPTARHYGTTTDALARMSGEQQLPFIEALFRDLFARGVPSSPVDYIFGPYGREDLVGASDDTVIDRADSSDPAEVRRYNENAGLDAAKKGYITVGDLRGSMRSVLNAAHGHRVMVPPPSSDDGLLLVALLGLVFFGKEFFG